MERMHVLRTRQLLDDEDFNATLVQLREIIGLKVFALWWPALKQYYRADFAAYVESLAPASPGKVANGR